MPLPETLDSIGAPGDRTAAPGDLTERRNGWARVASLEDLPAGSSKKVYFEGEQVALFNVDGKVYALDDRCSHANASLSEGALDGGCVVCPGHGSRFDLASGEPSDGPASRTVRTYGVRVESGNVYLAPSIPRGVAPVDSLFPPAIRSHD
jgi:3-phenylpropionate/trans-cinnamate dioxygenase ferredoxin subunit